MQSPILITGAAGTVGHVACKLLTERRSKVRALVRSEDARSAKLANLGVEIVVGDLLDLHAMHRAIEGSTSLYHIVTYDLIGETRPSADTGNDRQVDRACHQCL